MFKVNRMNAQVPQARTSGAKLDEAEARFRAVLESRRRLLGDSHPHTANSARHLGRLLLETNRPTEALPLLRAAHAAVQAYLPETHIKVALDAGAVGDCLFALGRYDEAEPLLVERAAAARERLGAVHDRTINADRAVVELYEAQGRPDDAARYRAALEEQADGNHE
jgi:tetratricopeptide (TPR) repeat protein